MQIQVNTDNQIRGDARLEEVVRASVDASLGRFGDRITRVEVHIMDVNGRKGGVDKRCTMEARPAGRDPVAVSYDAESIPLAIDGAAEKLERLLENTFGKLDDRSGRTPHGGPKTIY